MLCLLNHCLCPHPVTCRSHLSPGCWQGRGRDTFIYYRGKNKPKRGFFLHQLRLQQKNLKSPALSNSANCFN